MNKLKIVLSINSKEYPIEDLEKIISDRSAQLITLKIVDFIENLVKEKDAYDYINKVIIIYENGFPVGHKIVGKYE